MSILSQISLACNSIVLKDVLFVMFENGNDIDLKLVSDTHTTLDVIGMRIRVRAKLILEVEKQGYSPEVYESLKLLQDLQEIDNAKAREFMKVINETEITIPEKNSLIVHLRTFKTGDVKFVWRVLPHKLGLKVTNLDLLGVIKDKELFGKLVDDDVVCVCLLLALEVWNDFRWGEYIWRHLYDQILNLVNKNKWEHLPGLSKSRNYVPTYTLSGFVWSFKVMLPEVLMQGKIFDQKGIDHTTYNITFANAVKVPKQAGVFGDCGI
nr:phospholipase-like protein [Tanacetum cinerariifolium]